MTSTSIAFFIISLRCLNPSTSHSWTLPFPNTSSAPSAAPAVSQNSVSYLGNCRHLQDALARHFSGYKNGESVLSARSL